MIIRYELLREAPVIPEILHSSVGLGILKYMEHSPALGYSNTSFIQPWWEQIAYKNLRLGVIRVGKYPGGAGKEDYYFVERLVKEPAFIVRSQVFDCEGYPLKASSIPVHFGLSLSEALRCRLRYSEVDASRFYDIFPQDI